jgi:hypothetical protein
MISEDSPFRDGGVKTSTSRQWQPHHPISKPMTWEIKIKIAIKIAMKNLLRSLLDNGNSITQSPNLCHGKSKSKLQSKLQ